MIQIKAAYPDSENTCQVYCYANYRPNSLLAAVIRCSTMNRISLDLKAWIEVDGKRLDQARYDALVRAIELMQGPAVIEDRLRQLVETLQ